jgi:YVTN family beta-propeller protein
VNRRVVLAAVMAIVGLLALAPGAMARSAYVANSGDGTVAVFDTTTNSVSAVIAVGGKPVDVAISPNGAKAYVANKGSNAVDVIDTGLNVRAVSIPVGKEPTGIAASPDGHRVYVANFGEANVSAIDTGTNSVVGIIPVGKEPDGVAISPDGTRLLVAQRGGDVAVIDTGANAIVGSVNDPQAPSRLAIRPRGGRAFVTNSGAATVTAFTPSTGNLTGSPIVVGSKPAGIAIAPNGNTAYVASPVEGTVTPIDTSLDAPLSGPIGGFPGATGIAIRPDGLQGYVTNATGSTVSILDTTNSSSAGAIPVGAAPTAVAVVPDQGPQASFFISPARRRAKKVLTFHASGSKDPDGKIADYAWDFGDGGRLEGSQLTRTHRYKQPGTYLVTLTVTDDEGCSSSFTYTGQTASCNGSAAAVLTSLITVADTAGPVLRLAGAKTQSLGGRVSVRARCPREPCGLRAHGVLTTSIERNGETISRNYRIGMAQAPALSLGWRKLRLRVPGSARRAALRARSLGGEVKAKISVIARDEDDELRLVERKVKLVGS